MSASLASLITASIILAAAALLMVLTAAAVAFAGWLLWRQVLNFYKLKRRFAEIRRRNKL